MINEDINKNNKKIKCFLNDINAINDESNNNTNINNFNKIPIIDKEKNKEKNKNELIKPNIKEGKN